MPPPDLPDAQQLIQACWDKSTPLRESPDAAQQRAGFDQTADCLEETIMAWLKPLGVGEFYLDRQGMQQQLDDIRTATRSLYAMIYGSKGSCTQACDKRPAVRHIHILEQMLTALVRTATFHTGQWARLSPAKPHEPVIPDSYFASLEGLPRPKELIDKCWDISLEDRSSINNTRLREGHGKTVLCLKEQILKLHESWIHLRMSYTRADMDQELDRLSFAIQRFYWAVGNDNEYCGMSCGTIWFSYHLPPVSNLFSDIIRVMIAQMAKAQSESTSDVSR